MAYNVKYRSSFSTNTNGSVDSHTVEILKRDYTGSVTDITLNASEGGWKHIYENLDPKKIYDKPIQKARLELYLQCRGEGVDQQLGYDGLSILQEIFSADETEFLMQRKLNGSVVWKGWVLPDLLEFPDGEYTYSGKIIAKDFTRLSGVDIAIPNGNVRAIYFIAEILNKINFDLPIYSYTTWNNLNFPDLNDFLDEIYVNRAHLLKYTDTPDKGKINAEKALQYLLKNFGLILRQTGGGYRLYQISAFQNPSTVTEFQYDKLGFNYVNNGAKDLTATVDSDKVFMRPNGINQVNPALKSVTTQFNHQNPIQSLTEGKEVITITAEEDHIDSSSDNIEYSVITYQSFVPTGSQNIYLTGAITVDQPLFPESDVYTVLTIKAGQYYYDGNTKTWNTNSDSSFVIYLDRVDDNTHEGILDFYTASPIPQDANGDIEITFRNAQSIVDADDTETEPGFNNLVDDNVDETIFFNLESGFSNPANPNASRSSILFQLQQENDFSSTYDYGETIWGDGPTEEATSAIRYFFSGEYSITKGDWGYVGETKNKNLHELILKENLNIQRNASLNFDANLMGNYKPGFILQYKDRNLFFIGGEITAYNYNWNARFLDVQINKSSNDTFSEIVDRKNDSGSTNISSGSGSSANNGSTNGISKEFADQQYLNQNYNGSDISDKSEFRDNLSVYGKGESDNRYLLEENNLSELDTIEGSKSFTGDNTFEAGLDINQQYTDIGLDYAGSNIGLRMPRSGASNKYLLYDATKDRIGTKNGSAGNTDPFILESDIFPDKDYQNLGSGDDVAFRELLIKEGITLDDLASFVQSQQFAGGFVGEGFQLKKDEDDDWKLTIDDLVIRNSAKIYELIVTQLQAFAEFLLTEGHKVEEVEQTGSAFSWTQSENPFAPGATDDETGLPYTWADQYKCYIPEDKLLQLAVNDLLLRQDFDGRNVGSNEATVIDVEQGSVVPTDNTPRRSFTVYLEDNSAVPLEGWQFARSGNTSDPDRQGGIYFVGTGDSAPFTRIYDGVDRHSKFGKQETIISQRGKLDGIVDPDFDTLDGTQNNLYGDYGRNKYIKGEVVVTGGNAATEQYVNDTISQSDGTGDLRDELDAIFDNAITNEDTIIQNGFIDTSYIKTDAIQVGDLADGGDYALETFVSSEAQTAENNANNYTQGYAETPSGAESKAQTAEDNANNYTQGYAETPSGAESKAQTAEDNANNYTQGYAETPSGAQSRVNSLQGDIDAAFDNAITDGTTIIANGFIDTDFINVDDILAKNATVTAQLTMGIGSRITNASSDFRISEDGVYLSSKEFGAGSSLDFLDFANNTIMGSISQKDEVMKLTTFGLQTKRKILLNAYTVEIQRDLEVGNNSIFDGDALFKSNVEIQGAADFVEPIQLPTYTNFSRPSAGGLPDGSFIYNATDGALDVCINNQWVRV